MKQWLKRNFGLLYIALLTLVLIIVLVNSHEMPRMIRTLGQLRVNWVWASAACIGLYVLMRAVTLHYYLHSRNCAPHFYQTLIVTCIGQFYSAITPSASGGQPMQVVAMRQIGIPVAIGTAAVSIKFIMFQLAFMLMGGVLWTTHTHLAAEQLGSGRWLVALGYLINLVLVVAVIGTMFRQPFVDKLVHWSVGLGVRLKLIRHPEKALLKAETMLNEYRASLETLRSRPRDAVVLFLLSLAQVFFLMSVVCCLFWAFRLTGTDPGALLTLQLLLFITAAFVPLPGAAGVQEGGFYLFFRGLIPDADMVTFMVCWRFFTYYLLLLAGLIAVMADYALRRSAAQRIEAK